MKISIIILKHRVLFGIALVLILISGYFYLYNQFWTHLDPKTFQYMTEYTASRIRGHQGRQILVHRAFYNSANQINHYAIKNNLHLLITQSYRPPNKKIYDAIVTPAVKSNHLAGHALDFNIIYGNHVFESDEMFNDQFYKLPNAVKHFISDIQADSAVRWGGDFTSQDPVHLDDAININDLGTWKMHYHQCVSDYIHAEPKWKNWVRRVLKGLRSG